ncbi:type II secretion system protein GspM [Acidovorax cavernicola]|nr:type II secretion system protein GspM [Acidovorax cavernicola]
MTRSLDPARKMAREAASRWHGLPARDRLGVGVAALTVALAILWLGLTRPALDTVARWQRDLPKLRAQSAELDKLLADVPSAHATPNSAAGGIDAALDRAGLRGRYRLHDAVADGPPAAGSPSQPARAWRVEFPEPVPAAQVFAWLVAVSARRDLEITRVELESIDSLDGSDANDSTPQGRVRGAVALQSTQLNKDGQ